MAFSEGEREEKAFHLSRFFKPAAPIQKKDLFAGRKPQMRAVVDAINQDGRHVVLYGERGVGKTSLSNMLFPAIQFVGSVVMTPQINCTSQDTFAAIWKRVFEEIQFEAAETEELELPETALNRLADYTQQYADDLAPDVVRRVLLEIGKEVLLVTIIDEFETVELEETRQTMADTLKFLSDRNVPATVVLIGVADDVEGLIRDHESTERCLLQVPMPRMSREEITEIITNGLENVEMTVEASALRSMSSITKGLPHYAHLLGLHAGRAALDKGKTCVMVEDLMVGIKTTIDKVQASVQRYYRQAISSSRKDAQFKNVLLACAMSQTDEFGYFAPVDVRAPLSKIRGASCEIESFSRHLHAFSESDRGPVLKREAHGTSRPRFRFHNPLVQPYVLLRGFAEALIKEEDLREAMRDQTEDGLLF